MTKPKKDRRTDVLRERRGEKSQLSPARASAGSDTARRWLGFYDSPFRPAARSRPG